MAIQGGGGMIVRDVPSFAFPVEKVVRYYTFHARVINYGETVVYSTAYLVGYGV